jgi:hypothetical protein
MRSRQTHQPSWPGQKISPWAASSRPPSNRRASPRRDDSIALVDARALGVKPGHGEVLYFGNAKLAGDFKYLKFFSLTLFPFLNSFLYESDGPERPHASRQPRHRGGAFARATAPTGGRGWRETGKSDEQFYCRSQTSRRPARQSQRATPRPAFDGISREPQGASQTAQGVSPHARPRPCPLQTDARNRADTRGAARSRSRVS